MRSVAPWAVTVFALGCSFDASGIAETSAGPGAASSSSGAGGSGDGPGSSGGLPGSSGEAVTTGGTGSVGSSGPVTPETTGGPTTDEPGTTTGGPQTGDDTGADASTTTGAPACPQPYKQVVTVEAASVVAPMGKFESTKGEGIVAYSLEAEQGIVNFPFELPCAGEVAVWARVRDAWGGVHMNNDPDSYYPHVDNQAENGWPYGCQTEGMDDNYHWLRVRMGTLGDDCADFTDWRPQLAAGVHTVSLRNREAVSGQAAASVSRVLVTYDLGYVPQGD